MRNTNETRVFTKTKSINRRLEDGTQTTQEVTTNVGFLEYLSEDIRRILARGSKLNIEKWSVNAGQFAKVMAFYDSVNAARWDVDYVDKLGLEKYNILSKWTELFLSPRDVRFLDNRISCPNVVAANEDVILCGISRGEFNAAIDYISSIMRNGQGIEALSAVSKVEALDVLANRPLFVNDEGELRIYCRSEATELKAPVFVDASIAYSLYGEDKWDYELDEFKDLFLEALRRKFTE